MIRVLSPSLYEKIKYFIPRLLLPGLGWGDIVLATENIKDKDSEFWSSWYEGWYSYAKKQEERAHIALQTGKLLTARDAFLRASACYHWSEFMFFAEPEIKERARLKVTECFDRAIECINCKVEKVSLLFNSISMPGYFLQSNNKNSCVILVNGLDSAKEVELFTFAKSFRARGMSALIFDGPGQGELTGKYGMVLDFENVVDAAIVELKNKNLICNKTRIGIFGVSFGGYLALRVSGVLGDKISACINLSGGYDLSNFFEISPRIKNDFAYVYKQPSIESMNEYALQHITLRDIPSCYADVLCIHGEYDRIFPYENCEKIKEWCNNNCEIMFYRDEAHVCQNYFHEYIPIFTDWMAKKLEKDVD